MTTETPHAASAWWQTFFDDAYRRVSAPMLSEERTASDVAGVLALTDQHLADARPPRAPLRALDLCGGDGRVAAPLAAQGWDVTVLDWSPDMLRAGARQHPALTFVQGDARALPFAADAFDVTLNLFSAFGYFDDDAEHLTMLAEAARCLRPGGVFILDLTHRDHFVTTLAQPCTWYLDPDGAPVWRACVFDPVAGVSHERLSWVGDDGHVEERAWRCRIFTATEIAHMLRAVGLQPLAWHGGLDLSPFAPDLPGLAVAAQKPLSPQKNPPLTKGAR